jgi:hypothetical protein
VLNEGEVGESSDREGEQFRGDVVAEFAASDPFSEDRLEFADERRLRPHHARVEPGGAHQALAHEHAGEGIVLTRPGAESGERRREPVPCRGFGGGRAGGGGLRNGLWGA